jgi:hypothetical protein
MLPGERRQELKDGDEDGEERIENLGGNWACSY